MELTTEDRFGDALAQLPAAPNHHTPGFADDVGNFVHDLGQPGLGQTGRTARAAFTGALENDIGFGISDDYMLAREYSPLVEVLNQAQQRHPGGLFSKGNRVVNPMDFQDSQMPADYTQSGGSRDGYLNWFWGQVEQERQRNPGVFSQLPKDHGEAMLDARAEQRAAHDYAAQLQGSGGAITGKAAGFVGGAAGGMADPLNAAVSVAGFPAATSLLKTALIEGAGNAVVTLAEMPGRAQHYQDIGEPMSAGDMAEDVGGAAALGATFGVGGKLIGRLMGLHGHELVQEFENRFPDAPPSYRTAAATVEDRANVESTSPFENGPEGRDLHRRNVETAQAAIDNRDFGAVPDFTDHVTAAANDLDPRPEKAFLAAQAERETLRGEFQDMVTAANAPDAAPQMQAQIETAWQKLASADTKVAELGAALSDVRSRAKVPLGADGAPHPGAEFTTAKGSTYVVHPDGTTTRNKAARNDAGHEGDFGAKPRSAKTVYLESADHAAALSAAGLNGLGEKGARVILKKGKASLLAWNDSAQKWGRAASGKDIPFFTEPVIGRSPLELWKPAKDVPGFEAYSGMHAGNPIIDLRSPLQDSGAPSEAVTDALQHRRAADPEALKHYSDPVKKPEAFTQQASDLARELAPPPEKPKDAPTQAGVESPYGDAAPDIEALERLPQNDQFPDPDGALVTVKSAAAEIKRQARAVERLRACVEEA